MNRQPSAFHSGPCAPTLRGAVRDALSVLFPTACSGCGADDAALCSDCRAALQPRVHQVARDGFTAWVALDYAGAARSVIAAYKDGGRTDAATALAGALRPALAAALASTHANAHSPPVGIEVVTIPSAGSAWGSRGYHPVNLLVARCGLRPVCVLKLVADTVDQVGLTRSERAENKRGSLRAVGRLDGREFLIVDDIVTTGASIRETIRALTAAGGSVVGVSALAETPRRYGAETRSQDTGRRKL